MFEKGQMNELAERRRLLVMEAELHRSLIGMECESLRERLAGLQAARKKVAASHPLMIAGGAVAGLLALRHWRKLASWGPTVFAGLRWMKAFRRSEAE
jgi:hypothetical protein